jgi:NTP pyrophosphatase (non-canonical NTP hydrolase)/phosphopantetheinyl transferase (holo-ACP synthase)
LAVYRREKAPRKESHQREGGKGMRPVDYAAFVEKTKQFVGKPTNEQRSIALYGLVSEIGSLVAAVKKRILSEAGEGPHWDQPNDEIKEELGDSFWYCYSAAHVMNGGYVDILADNIGALRTEMSGGDDRAHMIAQSLDPANRIAFLEGAAMLKHESGYTFDDYQRLAYKTARTDGRVLLEVCLALLWQHGAELLRTMLPANEVALHTNVANRRAAVILGGIAWHLSAIASLYHLSLDEVVESNCEKVQFRSVRGTPTTLHDAGRDAKEQFPRQFDVAFVRIGPQKSRMYFDGKPLGDDLTDNYYEDDGYRFHDAIHLAFIGHLGWSPVVRSLMKRKRKSRDDRVDEVEDGGRAKVVEELVIKAIHTEGDRQAKAAGRCVVGTPTRLFPERTLINFKLLKMLRAYVDGLEVAKNTFWEWEDAIFDGCDMFFQLSNEKQGTVHIDLERHTLSFSPTVCPAVQGISVGLGMGSGQLSAEASDAALGPAEREWAKRENRCAETAAAKRAILDALGLDPNSAELWSEIEVRLGAGNVVYVKAAKSVQQRAWKLKAVDYKIAFSRDADRITCTATAIADIQDMAT